MVRAKRLTVKIVPEARASLAGQAAHFGFFSPKVPNVPSITAYLAAIANGELFVIGPAERQGLTWLQASLEVIAAHPDIFCNGLPAEDREAALSFLERVRGQVKWQLGEREGGR